RLDVGEQRRVMLRMRRGAIEGLVDLFEETGPDGHHELLWREGCGPGPGRSWASMAAMRLACRPPSNGVMSHASRMASASSAERRGGPGESTLESWWARAGRADSALQQSVHRTPGTRLATIASPLPDPPSTMPRSNSPAATARATGRMKAG